MKEFIDLSVPVPCHEKWDNFRPTPQGRHCSSCNKEVVDFTRWSEGQIKDYFKSGKFGAKSNLWVYWRLHSTV